MSYYVYFLQDEDDAVKFLDALSEFNAIVWTGSAIKLPSELKNEIKNQISSCFCKYTIIPQTGMGNLQLSDREESVDMIGIEFLVCCKRNPLSRTYEMGRMYYKENINNSCNEQVVVLFCQLKKFMSENYSFSKNAKLYVAPSFKKKYGDNYLQATQLGRQITL